MKTKKFLKILRAYPQSDNILVPKKDDILRDTKIFLPIWTFQIFFTTSHRYMKVHGTFYVSLYSPNFEAALWLRYRVKYFLELIK